MTTCEEKVFGHLNSGEIVHEYILKNDHGMAVHILNYGCIVKNIFVPEKDGSFRDVILGFDSISEYASDDASFGAITGRYAGRIRGAAFNLDGKTYKLTANDGQNHLHGLLGKKMYEASFENGRLTLSTLSPDGEDGFPGNLQVHMGFELTDHNQLVLDYLAETDAPTHINLTTHLYLNLNGQNGSTIANHSLQVDGFMINEQDAEKLPTGRFLAVSGSDMDFQTPRLLGEPSPYSNDADTDGVIFPRKGIDHNFVLRKKPPFHFAGELTCPDTGLAVKVTTTQPGLQVYTAGHLEGLPGKNGISYPKYGGICLEPQHFPNSPNMPGFPCTRLDPGKRYHHQSIFEFYRK